MRKARSARSLRAGRRGLGDPPETSGESGGCFAEMLCRLGTSPSELRAATSFGEASDSTVERLRRPTAAPTCSSAQQDGGSRGVNRNAQRSASFQLRPGRKLVLRVERIPVRIQRRCAAHQKEASALLVCHFNGEFWCEFAGCASLEPRHMR
jgi:hypothetical protein